MLSTWLDHFGDWTPQLWREAKERLQWQPTIATAVASGFIQFCLVTSFSRQATDSAEWQFHLFHTLTWLGMLLLMLIGCYLLVTNLADEAKRGTLDLLRLSPLSNRQILFGKLLGVPILLYWAIGLCLPLHLWAGLTVGIPFGSIACVYGFGAIACGLIYCFALVHALSWQAKAQAWYVIVLAAFLFLLLLGLWLLWFTLVQTESWLKSEPWMSFYWGSVWVGLPCGGGSLLLWREALERFHHPPQLPPTVL
jgi:hypothetical protein